MELELSREQIKLLSRDPAKISPLPEGADQELKDASYTCCTSILTKVLESVINIHDSWLLTG
jgi:hypothetical protein